MKSFSGNVMEKLLENREIRPTAVRILVAKYLAEIKRAASMSDIESFFETSDRTTLYRTLKTFEEHGLVHQIDDGTGVLKYAFCEPDCNCEIEQDLHLHFHCTSCQETACLSDYKIPPLSLPSGYRAEDVNLVVKGVCNHCNADRK
ncbi:MAG TPA: transcriptional repressor [Flavobacteriaceae bacterium]|nr:transcriptional repressor [Flavobacteriaceae bacterium]